MVVISKSKIFCVHSLLLFIMVVLVAPPFFYSCKTPATIVEYRDTVITYRDTIISIQERTDTFYLPSIIIRDTVIINGNKAELRVKITDENKVEIICKENELQLKLDSVIQSKRIRFERIETKIINKCESKWHSFTSIFFYIVAGFAAIYLLIKK